MFGFLIGIAVGIAVDRFGGQYVDKGVDIVKGWFNKLDDVPAPTDEVETKDETESK